MCVGLGLSSGPDLQSGGIHGLDEAEVTRVMGIIATEAACGTALRKGDSIDRENGNDHFSAWYPNRQNFETV